MCVEEGRVRVDVIQSARSIAINMSPSMLAIGIVAFL